MRSTRLEVRSPTPSSSGALGFSMNAQQQQIIFAGASLLCASLSSIDDVRQRRIPNRITFPAIAVGLAAHTLGGGWSGLGDAALAGLIAGGVFLIFYLAGGMGAGDVKLMIAIGCLAGLPSVKVVVVATALGAAVFALVVSVRQGRLFQTMLNVGAVLRHHSLHGFEPHPDLNLSREKGLRLPFALPAAAGCLFTMCSLMWKAYS
jgi:prepilin peptidase CpaA